MDRVEGRSELLRAALAAVADGVIVVAADGTLLYANEAFGLMWGIPTEALGDTSRAFKLDTYTEQVADAEAFLEAIRRPAADESPAIGTVRFTDGRVLEYLTRLLHVQGVDACVLSFRDITARVAAEQERGSEGLRLATLLRHIPAAVYEDILDPTVPAGFRPVYMGEQIEAISGYTAEELTENAELWEAIVHPDDQERVMAENRAFYENPIQLGQVFRIVSKDGSTVWIHDWGHIAVDLRTGERHIYGVILDVTYLHEVEQRASELEVQWQAMLDEVPGVVYRYEAGPTGRRQRGEGTWVSPAAEELFGHTQAEWMADPDFWADMLYPDDREWVLRESERTERSGEPFDAEYRFMTRDGVVRWVHDTAVPVAFDEGEARWWLGLMMDVTERRTVLEQLVQAQEAERARIAREIEDTSMQAMAAAGLRASVTLARAGVVDDPGAAAVQMAIEEAVSGLRRLLLELRPISLDRGELSGAAGQYLRLLADSFGSDLRFDDRLTEQPEEPLRTVAYRVIQAMGRATLGAGLSTAFHLEPQKNGIRIMAVTATSPITDDVALSLARERARFVGGRFEVSSDGTTAEVWLPGGASDQR